jgi:hypothetical protein
MSVILRNFFISMIKDERNVLPVLPRAISDRAFLLEAFGSFVSTEQRPDVVRRPLRRHRSAGKEENLF